MSDEDVPTAAGTGTGSGSGGDEDLELEPLACVTCRSRKLKCDRIKPACTRCARLLADCAYPESRRKPAFKRRNVKELEKRLAQVEVLLKDAAGKTAAPVANGRSGTSGDQDVPVAVPVSVPQKDKQGASIPAPSDFHTSVEAPLEASTDHPMNWDFGTELPGPNMNEGTSGVNGPGIPGWGSIYTLLGGDPKPRSENAGTTSYELLGLGLFESLPPFEMIEDLHQTYFLKQHPLVPIIHPGRYMQAFYSAPHLRPPMALQYAIWTMATNGHPKYSNYHDVFHRRCRHYLQEDELKGDGEHFLTIAHAQAWALTATNEARCMWFTRAAMSASRCIKLLHMMGLHRLDHPNAEFEMAPTIAPPKDWTELEERRRVFWGAFAIDSHAAIATGWPTLIEMGDVTTHLPSSEEAFLSCQEEKACRLEDVFSGSSYSSFAGTAVICHLFNQIMQHVHRSKPDDCPENYEYGKYWNRHRELDNLLSSAFMFLPERFRLPQNIRDPVAVHTNLNLHASLICLHNSAYEMAYEHNLSEQIKQFTKTRLFTAAQEIVNIVKLTSHSNSGFKSPLVALALYVSSSVYTQAQNEGGLSPMNISNLQFLLTAMEAIGQQHRITMSFLRQACMDIQAAGLEDLIRIPKFGVQSDTTGNPVALGTCPYNIPLFARSRVSKRYGIQPPLPGRLPLNNPIGRRVPTSKPTTLNNARGWSVDGPSAQGAHVQREVGGNAHKRKRGNLSPSLASSELIGGSVRLVEEILSSDTTTPCLSSSSGGRAGRNVTDRCSLPYRHGSSTSASSPAVNNKTSTPMTSGSGFSPMGGGVMLTDEAAAGGADLFGAASAAARASRTAAVVDTSVFQGLDGWDVAGDGRIGDSSAVFAQVTEAMLSDDSWMILNEGEVSNGSWGEGGGGGGGAGVG